jgi:hypothetical protein
VPLPPSVADYAPAANIQLPTRVSELSTVGLKAFKEDLEHYKMLDGHFKNIRHTYEDEKKSLQHIVAFMAKRVFSICVMKGKV